MKERCFRKWSHFFGAHSEQYRKLLDEQSRGTAFTGLSRKSNRVADMRNYVLSIDL
jgi:hypothetical protein